MTDKMCKKIFLFLWTIGIIQHRSTSIPINCAQLVQKCPVGKDQWIEKNNLLKCTTNYGYVCLRNSNGYLFETCMDKFPIQANSGNCPILFDCKNRKTYLGPDSEYYPCPEEVAGCPPKNHPEYRIQQLYKYPKCIESNFSDVIGNTSPKSITSISMDTRSADNVNWQENIHFVILIVILVLLLIACASYALYPRIKHHGYALAAREELLSLSEGTVPGARKKVPREGFDSTEYGKIKDFRSIIREINESEADRVQFLQKEYTIEVDKLYAPVLIVDDYEKHTCNSNITLDKMLYVRKDNKEKRARFVFMLGDAGCGKTIQCQRISKLWCEAWKNEKTQEGNCLQKEGNDVEVKHLERRLKEFDFLFFIQMRYVNDKNVSLIDMIQDAYSRYHLSKEQIQDIRTILEGKCKCLVLLDGLDEWNISEEQKKEILDENIPNCRNMPNCTILITMRSWMFMEVEHICRPKFDKVVRIYGMDDEGIKQLTINMLCHYFNIERDSPDFITKLENITQNVSSASIQLRSLMKIPLLAVFCILTWNENVETGHSLTTFYLSMIEAMIKRYLCKEKTGRVKGDISKRTVPILFRKYSNAMNFMSKLSGLGKIAFDYLTSKNANLVLSDEQLTEIEVKETVDIFLKIGLLNKHKKPGPIHEDNVGISFLHKTIQEFISSLYLFYGRSDSDIEQFVSHKVSNIEKALDLSAVLTFLSGLSPAVGCKISNRIAKLSSEDPDICRFRDHFSPETYYKVFHIYNLQLSCYREVRGWESIEHFPENEMKYSFSDIILLGNDADRLTIRESADVLRYHANDIISLCMKCIPSDSDKGISNNELADFLQRSQSVTALNIDGYDGGKCRVFDDLIRKMPRLRTLGLYNVAFTKNVLTEFLRKDESKRKIHALGLLYIKSTDDLDVDYQYQFSSVHRTFVARSGYDQKRTMRSMHENSYPQLEEKGIKKTFFKDILKVFPTYSDLSTFFVTYMESAEDRQMLLKVLPHIKKLEHFGYHGSSIYPKIDFAYDANVIKTLLDMKHLRIIFLNQIILKEKILNFENFSTLERIKLQLFQMNKTEWCTFVASLSNIKHMSELVLNDTNIDAKSYEKLKSFRSLELVKDESTTW